MEPFRGNRDHPEDLFRLFRNKNGQIAEKKVIFYPAMAYVLLIIASLIGLGVSLFFLKKNVIRIREKNKNEPKAYKRKLNYVLTGLWYGYLIVFFVGLTINNTVF